MWLESITAGLKGRRISDEMSSMSGNQRLCAEAAGLITREEYARAAEMYGAANSPTSDAAGFVLRGLCRMADYMATGEGGRRNCADAVHVSFRRAVTEDPSLEDIVWELEDTLKDITRLSIWNLLGMSSLIDRYATMMASCNVLRISESTYRAVWRQHLLDPMNDATVGPSDDLMPLALLVLYMSVCARGEEIVLVSDRENIVEVLRGEVAQFGIKVGRASGGAGIRVVKPDEAPESCWLLLWDAPNPPRAHMDGGVQCARLVVFRRHAG